MKNIHRFNKFYTILHALAVIAILSQLLILYKYLNFQDMFLFLVLIAVFVIGFVYSLGFIGGKDRGYGFSKFTNIISLLTLFLVTLSEIEFWIYLEGFHNIVIVAFIQIIAITIIFALCGRKINVRPHTV